MDASNANNNNENNNNNNNAQRHSSRHVSSSTNSSTNRIQTTNTMDDAPPQSHSLQPQTPLQPPSLPPHRDVLAEILNMSVSDLSLSVDMELQQQQQQQQQQPQRVLLRSLLQPLPRHQHTQTHAHHHTLTHHLPPPQQEELPPPPHAVVAAVAATAAAQNRGYNNTNEASRGGDESTCCTDLMDDEQVTSKPLLKKKDFQTSTLLATSSTNRSATRSTTRSTTTTTTTSAARATLPGSHARRFKKTRRATTVVAAMATATTGPPSQRKQQPRRFLRLFSRKQSPPPTPPPSFPPPTPPMAMLTSPTDTMSMQVMLPLQPPPPSPMRTSETPTTYSITSLDALRRQRSLVNSANRSIHLRAPQFMRRPNHATTATTGAASDHRNAAAASVVRMMQGQESSPNSVLEFRVFRSNSDISKSSSIHWTQEPALEDGFHEEGNEEQGQDNAAVECTVESSDVCESPVGMIRVNSFPYLGHVERQGQEANEEEEAKDQFDMDGTTDGRLNVSSKQRRSDRKSAAATSMLFVTPDGFPVLDATNSMNSMDTEIASNVTVAASSASASIVSSTASRGILKKTTKSRTTLSKAASETSLLQRPSHKVRLANKANAKHHRDQPSTASSQSSSSQSATTMYQLLEDVAERVSGMSLEAGNSLLSPIQACTAPVVDTFVNDGGGDDDHHHYQNMTPKQQGKTTKPIMLSCTAGCAALEAEFAAFEQPTMARSLKSTPDGFQTMDSSKSDYYYDFAPCRSSSNAAAASSGATADELVECPSTEITLEVTYPSKNATEGRVMALGEKCDEASGDVVVQVAMLSQQEPSPATSLLRKRQIVSAAKRWSSLQPKQESQASPTPQLESCGSELSNASSTLKELTPVLRVSTDYGETLKQPPSQPVLSSSLDEPLPPNMPRPPSSLSSRSRTSKINRFLPRRRSAPVSAAYSMPSLFGTSDDQEEHSAVHQEEHRHHNNQTPTILGATTTAAAAAQQHQKGIRISPISVTEFRDGV